MSGATVGVGVGLGFPSQILILPSGAPVYPEPANLPAEEGSCKINAAQKLPCWSSLCQGGGEGLLELPKQAPPAQPLALSGLEGASAGLMVSRATEALRL